MKTCRRKWFVQWVAAFVSIVLFGTYLGSLSMNTLTVSAICCRKDGFDKSRYTLTGNVAQDVATIAKSQAGRTCSDFGYSGVDYGAWCDEYVADCLENAGCDDSIVAHGGTVADFEKKMRKRGAVVVSSPQPGDLLFFSWSHVEIVTRVEGGTVYCAGGNNQGKTYPGGRCAGERNAQSVAKSMGGSIRLYLRPNYKGVNPNPPTNISIQADRTTITAGESITFTYTIENSTDSCIGIDKDGSRFDTIGVSGTSGTVSYTFSQPGVYCVITAGSNPYGSACCDGVWIKVNEKTAPFNISIQADKTTIIAGESVSFSYTIENSTDSCIGIDKDGSRFDTIGVSGTSGTVSYTFSQPGVYCVITAGSNPYGSACCDGVWIKVNEKTAPFNISIQADRTEIVMGESITFTYTIENSTDSCIGIDKDGSRFDTVNVSGTSGSISYTFSQPGVYCVITAGSNPYGAACCDGVWIKVNSLPGDLNSDNTLTTADAVLLQRYLLQERTLTQSQWQTADLNADGTVNGFDLALLRQKLVG
ncbi:dockerin type I domain-containing protein [Ruminococcus callidus]|uniref:dockerin type I domain-containing protein n=2 Tax=Ruminococcus callidus TaxID=40519 RepID=UPI003995DB25